MSQQRSSQQKLLPSINNNKNKRRNLDTETNTTVTSTPITTITTVTHNSKLYRNRTHSLAFARAKENGALQAKQKHNQELEATIVKRMKLQQHIDASDYDSFITDSNVEDILVEREVQSQLNTLTLQQKKLENLCPEKQWFQQVQCLQSEFVESLIVLNFAGGNFTEIFTVDPERHECGRIFKFENVLFRNVCPFCKESFQVLIATEDIQSDSVLAKTNPSPFSSSSSAAAAAAAAANGSSPLFESSSTKKRAPKNTTKAAKMLTTTNKKDKKPPNEKPERKKRQQKFKAITPQTIDLNDNNKIMDVDGNENDEIMQRKTVSKHSCSSRNNVASVSSNTKQNAQEQYRRYLMQFAPDACEIPIEIWQRLCESVASTYCFSNQCSKPIPIAKILRDCCKNNNNNNNNTNNFFLSNQNVFMGQVARLQKLFAGEPVPELSHQLIERLVGRFEQVQTVAEKLPNVGIKYLPNHEILTHCFLQNEEEHKLATAFITHKTNNTSQIQISKFRTIIAACSKLLTNVYAWKYNS